jgi:fatty-acyl-CoA synthase
MPIRLAERARDCYSYPLLVKHLLHAPLATAPHQEIVYRDRSRYTYLTFRARIAKLAAGLAGLGVEAGTTVAVMDWDSHRYLECFFAIPMMGAVLQTVNIRLTPGQIAYTLRHAAAEVILVHRDFVPVLAAVRDQLPVLRAVVLIDDGAGGADVPGWTVTEYERLLDDSGGNFVFDDFDENALATTFYTTGTTGDPKGVCFSHRQLVLHTLALMGALGSPAYGQSFRHGDVYMPMTPMFHVHAWGNPYVATALGVKQVYPGRYIPEELLALRTRESVTFSHCVPTILQMLLTAAADTNTNLQGWKICIGGSVLPASLAQEALNKGIDVYAGYGMSETGPVLAVSRLIDPPGSVSAEVELERRCRAGLPIPLVDLTLTDAEWSAVPRDGRSVGEIVVRAPWLTPCYVGNPEASEELWRGGYLHTQDVARIDPSGYLQITDRVKDVIKTGGEWLSSLQLEQIISAHPGVAEVAVVGMRDARWGERPHALVVPRPHYRATLTPGDICSQVAAAAAVGTVPRYAVPDRVTFVEALERTSVGKINKRLLRERYS